MEFEVAKGKAVNFIGISKKTAYEVKAKLKRLSISDSTIIDVVSYLEKLGYIDDKEYVRAFVRQNIKMEKYSIFEIKQKLLNKGISKDIIDENMDKLYEDKYEEKVIKRLLQSKLASFDKDKQVSYLYRRGFKLNG